MKLYRKYSLEYGQLTDEGLYAPEEHVRLIDRSKGKVIWKYVSQKQGLIYVLDDETTFPGEVKAEVIVGKV